MQQKRLNHISFCQIIISNSTFILSNILIPFLFYIYSLLRSSLTDDFPLYRIVELFSR